MPVQCKAAVFTGPGEVEVGEVSVPDPGPNEVLIRAEVSLISNGTERWAWSGRFHSPGRETGLRYPAVPGYQRVGRVERVGSDVTLVREGDRVAATIGRLDGPVQAFWGSHSAMGLAAETECYPLPESVSSEDAAGLVLTQVGYNGGTRPPVEPGSVAVVIGDGLVGQWAAQTFRARGAHTILCGRRAKRLAVAAKHSADEVLDARETDVEAVLRGRYPNGVDIVDEAVGLLANVDLAVRLLGHDRHLVLNGYHPEGEHLMNIQWLHDKEVTCWGMAGWTKPRMLGTLDWLQAGKLKVRELVTHEFPADRVDEAYRLLWGKTDDFLGLLLRW